MKRKYRVGLFDIAAVAIVLLKLTGLITWAWVWVLSPLWIALLFGIVLGILKVVMPHTKAANKFFDATWFLWTRK